MAKAEWGVKRICPSCAARFYDLLRDPIVCPACGVSIDLAAPSKPKRVRAAAVPLEKTPAPKEPELEDDLVDDDLDDVGDDDDVLDLDDDDDVEDDAIPAKANGGDKDDDIDDSSFSDDDDVILEDDDDDISLDDLDEGDVDDEEEER